MDTWKEKGPEEEFYSQMWSKWRDLGVGKVGEV